MIELPLSGAFGHVAVLIDESDFDLVRQFKWYRSVRGSNIYARRLWKEEGRWRPQYMHSLLTGWDLVDHIDRDGLNNTRANLRYATKANNIHNSRPTRGVSRFKGVSATRDRWKAQIVAKGVHYHLGHHDTQEQAARAYDEAAARLFGRFAYLNFPKEG